MKRPFAVIGFTGFAALLSLSLIESLSAAYCFLFITSYIGVLSLFKKNLRQAMTVPVCLFTAAAACLLFLRFNSEKLNVQSLSEDQASVEAVVAEAPYIKAENGRHYCILELCSIDGKAASGRLRLSFSPERDGINEKSLEIGNSISFTGRVYIPGDNEKSISRYFTGENILLGAYSIDNVKITQAAQRSISYYFQKLRHLVTEKLRYGFGDRIAGVLVGIMTGDKSCLNPRLYDSFRQTGIAHLMAVSGLHLSLWIFAIGSVVPQKRKTEKLRCLFLIAAVIFIMLLAGMSESVKRAGFMCLVFLSGRLFSQNCDSLNSLGIAMTVMIIYNPASVLSVSLQLSFLSTLGILTLGKLCLERSAEIFGGKSINSPLRKLMRYTADMFFISLSVLIFTFPVLISGFDGISTVSAWVNILISPVVAPLLVMAGLCVLLSGIPFLLYPAALITKLLVSYVIIVTELFSTTKNAFLVAERENTPLFIAAAVIIVFMLVILLCKPFTGRTVLTVSSIFFVMILLIYGKELSQNAVKIHLEDFGDTLAVAVQEDKSALLLFGTDEYEKELFVSALSDKGVRNFYELVDIDRLLIMNLNNGKYITDADGFSFNIRANEATTESNGKYIHIFYGEALQNEACCDIIIKILKNDVILSIGGKDFSLKEKSRLTLTITENKTILRGEAPWLNLMKSS